MTENINQTPNIQSIESTQSVSPIKNQNIFKILFIASLFVIFGIIIAFYLVLNNKINQLSNKQIDDITSVPTKQTVTTNNEITPTSIPIAVSTESTLVQKDANNNLYTNNKFGFSLVVPKTMKSIFGSCQENVSLTYFESGDTIYGDTIYLSDKSYFINKSCEKENTTLSFLENNNNYQISFLKIYATNVKNDNELEQFIKTRYGSGCKLGEKVDGEGDFSSVKIMGDGKSYDEDICQGDGIKVSYNQIKNKVVIFEVGQSYEPLDGVSSSLKFL